MSGALLSMLVEAARIYSRIVPVDMYFLKQVVYFVFDPAGEILQFFLLPVLAFAVFGKEIPRKLKVISKIYAVIIVATFPLEVLFKNPIIHSTRDLAGYFVFYSFSYVIIFLNYRKASSSNLQKVLRSYLILALTVIPYAFIFQTGIAAGFIHIHHPEIPFPYILYCLLFNILCLVNAYKYLFAPVNKREQVLTENFLQKYNITERENEIITLLLKGYNNHQIGKLLFISSGTVKNHVYNVFQKIGVENRTQLAYMMHLHHSK